MKPLRVWAGSALPQTRWGLTPAAVSQQIRALETRLGFRLFNRLARGVELSEMGRAYLPSVRQAFEDLEAATAGLFGLGPAKTVTVRAPISFAALRLAPAFSDFRSQHPDIPVRLCTSVWADGLDDSSIDIDIRYGDGKWTGADITRLTDPVSVPILPPTFPIETFLSDPEAAIATGPIIDVTGYESLWTLFSRAHGIKTGAADAKLAADSSLVALEMVAAGLGCAIIARDLASAYIANDRVRALPRFSFEHGHAHHLVLPLRARPTPPETLLFRKWLLGRFTPMR